MAFFFIFGNNRANRRFLPRRNPLDWMSDEEVIQRYRLDTAAINELTNRFSHSCFANRTSLSNALTPQLQVWHSSPGHLFWFFVFSWRTQQIFLVENLPRLPVGGGTAFFILSGCADGNGHLYQSPGFSPDFHWSMLCFLAKNYHNSMQNESYVPKV